MMGRRAGDNTPASALSLLQKAKQKQYQKTRQENGENAEQMVEQAMKRRGDRLVEKVEVPFRIDPRTGKQYAKRKVSGDFRAVRLVGWYDRPSIGASVLVEVKHHEERLSYSAFRPHQIVALDEHLAAGGITEVAWVDRGQLRFIPWARFREIGFKERQSVVWTGTTIEIHTRKQKETK